MAEPRISSFYKERCLTPFHVCSILYSRSQLKGLLQDLKSSSGRASLESERCKTVIID